jgi:hypothetical protein
MREKLLHAAHIRPGSTKPIPADMISMTYKRKISKKDVH